MDLGCTPKYLPAELVEPAAATAIAQNPANRPLENGSTADHSILSPSHIAVLVSKWWSSKGVDLTVAFMESIQTDLKNRILAHMNAWSEYANVRFRLSATDPQVRITRALEGYWSYLGTDILHINKNEATMCLQGFTMQTSEAEFRRVVRHETGHCLVGETLIDCPRDLEKYPLGIPIKDLVGTQPWVYAWRDGKIVVRKASRVWLSKKNAPTVRVKLKAGRGPRGRAFLPPLELVGTADHPVLLSDGKTWKNLGDLQSGDRLCSMYRSKNGERSRIIWTGGQRIREHVFVCEQVHGQRPDNHDCHHMNQNKMDQSVENLEWKLERLHHSEHSANISDKTRRKMSESQSGRKHSPETIAKLREIQGSREQRILTDEERAGLADKAREQFKGKKQSTELIAKRTEAMREFYANGGRSGMFGKTASDETRAKRSASMKATLARKKQLAVNHTVVSVEEAGYQDVYDMTVPDADNFVANGVVVHNSMGCPHEHMRSAIVDRIDTQKAIAYFRQTQGWSPAMVMSQVLRPLAESSLMGSPDADETSIMAYNLPGIITKDGRPIVGGDDIAPQDIEFIAKIYPKQSEPPQPPLPPVGKGLDLNMDFEKKQVHVRLPSGWTVHKALNKGEAKMSDQYCALADELEAALPSESSDLEAARATSFGGIVGSVQELIAALRSGDLTSIVRSVRNLLDLLLGEENTDTLGFAGQAAAAKIDWVSLIGVLMKLLPLILGGKS